MFIFLVFLVMMKHVLLFPDGIQLDSHTKFDKFSHHVKEISSIFLLGSSDWKSVLHFLRLCGVLRRVFYFDLPLHAPGYILRGAAEYYELYSTEKVRTFPFGMQNIIFDIKRN